MKKEITDQKQCNIFSIISLLCIISGLLLLVPNLIFKIPSFYVLLTIPLGITALFLSIKIHNWILLGLSCFVTISFFIFMAIGSISEALNGSVSPQYDPLPVAAPEYTEPITISGDIYNIIERSHSDSQFIYFGRTECSYCDQFNEKLSPILSTGNPVVYYYNTQEMPREEAENILKKFDIDRVPYLIKLDNGNVVNKVTVADEEKLKKFLHD